MREVREVLKTRQTPARKARVAVALGTLSALLGAAALALAGSPPPLAIPASSTSPSSASLPAPADAAADTELRGWLAHHLEDQQTAVAAAARTVDEKLALARGEQAQRARIAYRVLRHRVVRPADAVAAVRSRAAVKWRLARDRDEVSMLVDERQLLAASRDRLTAAALSLPTAPLPPRQLPWPAPGAIARTFGLFAHERSGATLSRRGLDLEVAERAPAHALAEGVVAYAGPVRGLDLAVLVDHGAYWTLVGKLATVEVTQGQTVASRAILGRAARRRLYLELRLKLLPAGIPVDPAPFLAKP